MSSLCWFQLSVFLDLNRPPCRLRLLGSTTTTFALSGTQPQTFYIFFIWFYRHFTGITSLFLIKALCPEEETVGRCHIVASLSNHVRRLLVFYIVYNPSIYFSWILSVLIETMLTDWNQDLFLSRLHFWKPAMLPVDHIWTWRQGVGGACGCFSACVWVFLWWFNSLHLGWLSADRSVGIHYLSG